MAFGKRQILAAFLEKDNIKLLTYDVSGRKSERVFAGQISLPTEILNDAFIADPAKFSSQVKISFNQKPPLAAVSEVVLFLPLDKTFTKALAKEDNLDSFIRTLPYFKEELMIQDAPEASNQPMVTHVAFERKLVEDFQRPFMEANKKIVAVRSAVNVLVSSLNRSGKYFVFVPFDKTVAVVLAENGQVLDTVVLPKDVFVGRLGEFIVTKNYSEIKDAVVLAVMDPETVAKLKEERGLTVEEVDKTDVYDLVVDSYLSEKSGSGFKMPSFSMPTLPTAMTSGASGKKYLFLIVAVIIGFVLVFLVAKAISSGRGSPAPVEKKVEQAAPTPPPPPAPKPADFPVRVLNGTSVTGEAGKLGDKLKALGFNVTETKNATSSGFVTTKLRFNSDVPEAILTQIEAALSDYATVVREPFADTAVKIEVIIGKRK